MVWGVLNERTSLNKMGDFEAPSFSLGFDFDSEDDFQNLIVDDSDPDEYHPDSNRIRRRVTNNATSSYVQANATLELRTGENLHTRYTAECTSSSFQPDRLNVSNAGEAVLTSSIDIKKSLSYAHRYFFHDDRRIQELVRIRLPNFSLLDDVSNSDLEQPTTSNIDYLGQFSCGESLKQASRNIKGKKSSNSRKTSRKLENEDTSEGWVNPKAAVLKVTTKGATKRTGHSLQTSGHWITGSDGKKVYVGRRGQELTGRGAYMQYKKESGLGFKKAKKPFATKKKK